MSAFSAAGAAAAIQPHADRAAAGRRMEAESWDALFRGCVLVAAALVSIRDGSTDPRSRAEARAALAKLGRP